MGNNRNRTTAQQFQWGLLLLLFFALRLYHLQALPLHNDEGLHLTRAVAVWNLHPFWDITDGKIINHWAIALFYPQNAPDFVARIATLFVVLPGVAAGYALVRHIAGHRAALISIGLWGLSPYLFFYERLAQSDAEAAAWVVVAVWAALLLTERGSWWAAVRVGVALSVATLMKFTAAPYAIVITLLILSLGDLPWCVRARHLIVIAAVGALAFASPLLYLSLRSETFFAVALGWISGTADTGSSALAYKAASLFDQMTGFGQLGGGWFGVCVVGWGLGLWHHGMIRRLLAIFSIPLLMIWLLADTVFPRHWVVTLPLLVLMAGAGWGITLQGWRYGRVAAVALAGMLLANSLPFYWVAYHQPGDMRVPVTVAREFLHDHGSGFGLRTAMIELPSLIPPDVPIVASMFPASCRRANFYLAPPYTMACTDAPGLQAIEAALNTTGSVAVVVDRHPMIGLPLADMPAPYELIGLYPRPGETITDATVILVLLHR